MVIVDMRITLALDIQIDQPMAGDLVQHVFKEGHTDIESGLAAAIEVDRALDLGFQGIALDGSLTFNHHQLRKIIGRKGFHYRPRTRQLETRMTYGKARFYAGWMLLQVYTTA